VRIKAEQMDNSVAERISRAGGANFQATPERVQIGRVGAGAMSLLERAALMPKTGGGLLEIATTEKREGGGTSPRSPKG
jgi:hypothetical protein